MRSLCSLSLALAAFGLAACDDPTGANPVTPPALAVTSNEYTRNYEDVAVNDCNGEGLPGTVRAHVLTTETADGAGGIHETFHLNATGKLSDQNGARYVFHQTIGDELNGKAGEERTIVAVFTLIGQGGVPNELSTFLLHFTITPDGSIPVDFVRGDLVCR